mgnify:FL=1
MSSNIDLKKICAFCGKEFIAHKTTTTCCSHRCSSLLYKQRKREAKVRKHDAVTEKVITEKPIEKIKDKPFISITEAALYMGVSRPTIYLYLRNGEISAKRMGSKYLIAREDIENLFNHPDKFEPVRNERKAITEFYTTQEILKRYGISNSGLYKIAQTQNFPKTQSRGKTLWSKPHIDKYFEKRNPSEEITEWYTVAEIQEKFGMTLSAIYCLVSKEGIPKIKVGIEARYSKKHFDIAKGIAEPEAPKEYSIAEAMEKFGMTRDQLYHYVKTYNITRTKRGKYTYISRKELDDLLAPPTI